MQKYSSKNTSVNTISKIYKKYDFKENSIILDYGCGKYDTSINFMKNKNCIVLPYDKYNRDNETNLKTLDYCKNNKIDYIVCSNVLNVIMEDEVIFQILDDLYKIANKNTVILISIYEGDKSGIGKETTKGYQKNMKLKEYLKYLNKFDILIRNQIFICKRKTP